MARIGQDFRGCLVHSKRVILIPLFSRAFFRRLYMLFKKNLREGWLYMLFKKNLREGLASLSQLTARFNYRSNWLSTKLRRRPMAGLRMRSSRAASKSMQRPAKTPGRNDLFVHPVKCT